MKMSYNNYNELLYSLKKGDIEAFNYIYEKYYSYLFAYVSKTLHNDISSHDITQDSFIKLWENRDKIISSPISFLFKTAYNSALNSNEHKKIVQNYEKIHKENLYYEKVIQHPEAEIALIESDIDALFEAAKNRLPERCRLIFDMKRKEGLKNKEIADILGISEKCVENQITIAISRLHKDLKGIIDNRYLFFLFWG